MLQEKVITRISWKNIASMGTPKWYKINDRFANGTNASFNIMTQNE
jgi:hypothetical protein